MVLYSIRSERRLIEELEYNLLYRWFVGLGMDESVWDATTFSKNRERFIDGEVARRFFDQVLREAKQRDLVSEEHFSVDGTLIEAWASLKSFRPKDDSGSQPPDDPGNATVNFRGERRSNETHQSQTDPEARLARKGDGKEAKLSYCGSVLIENRHGLVVDTELLHATGTAERDAAMMMAERIEGIQRVTLAGDKNYDARDFVHEMRHMNITPHVAQNSTRRGGSAIDSRTTRHAGYAVSQQRRKVVEELLVEDGRGSAQDPISRSVARRVDLHLRGCRLQPGANANPGRECGSSRSRIGRSVPERPEMAAWVCKIPHFLNFLALWVNALHCKAELARRFSSSC